MPNYQWLEKRPIFLLNSKSAVEHDAFSADSPWNQARFGAAAQLRHAAKRTPLQ
jgi:hypothetical protein